MDNPPQEPQQPRSDDAIAKPSSWWRLSRVWVLLVLFVALANWIGLRMDHTERQARLTQRIESLGGTVAYSYQGQRVREPQGPGFVRELLGDQYYVKILSVNFDDPRTRMATIQELAASPDLVDIDQLHMEKVEIDDKSIKTLESLTSVKQLYISGRRLTSTAIKELEQALPHTKIIRVP